MAIKFASPESRIIFVIEQKESGRIYDEWLKVIVHEMVHLYFYKKIRSSEPRWLFEGLACYIAGQKKEKTEISLKDLISPDSDNKKDAYVKGYNIIRKVLEE